MTLRAAIIGPGRSQQGTGPYIARTLSQNGVEIVALLSSSLNSAKAAAQDLLEKYSINAEAYSSLDELLENNEINILVISSPISTHQNYLHAALQANCHVFCEKPLWWPSNEVKNDKDIIRLTEETTALVKGFREQNLILQLNTQWPFTLPTYYEMYPAAEKDQTKDIENFDMWLAPQSMDKSMIIDAAPHLLSMLYAIVGAGRIENIQSSPGKIVEKELSIKFDYLHAFGKIHVSLNLNASDAFPKPAAYAINGKRVDRHVEVSNYLISLCASNKQAPIVDPLVCSIRNFISTIHSKSSPDETSLIDGMAHLAQIYQTVTTTNT